MTNPSKLEQVARALYDAMNDQNRAVPMVTGDDFNSDGSITAFALERLNREAATFYARAAIAAMELPTEDDQGFTAAVVALAEAGIPTDIQDILISGSPWNHIAPGALSKAIGAYVRAALKEEK